MVHGYSFRALGVGGPWRGVGTKLASYHRALEELVGGEIGEDDIVVLLDAWDTVILGPAEELRAKLVDRDTVVCAADRICAPEYRLAVRVEQMYPEIRTPWRYPNSGCIAGSARAVASLLHGLVQGDFREDGDDQLRLQEFLLSRAEASRPFPLRLDDDCRFFQCLGEPTRGWDMEPAGPGSPPRICNSATGQRPLVAHGCGGHGRWFLGDIYRDLRLLDYLGVTGRDLSGLPYAGLAPPGERVTWEHWVEQPPWDYPFQLFGLIRAMELARAR